jgi:hypothetical protein
MTEEAWITSSPLAAVRGSAKHLAMTKLQL